MTRDIAAHLAGPWRDRGERGVTMFPFRIFIGTLITASSIASMPARAAASPCAEGAPLATESGVRCTIDIEVNESSGRALAAQTLGLVSAIRVHAALELDTSPATISTMLTEHRIQIPAQDIEIVIALANGGAIPVSIELSPFIDLEGNDACTLTVTDASINVLRFDSALPNWIDETIRRVLDESPRTRAQLVEAANAQVKRAQQDLCTF